jgi:hypothetical protein
LLVEALVGPFVLVMTAKVIVERLLVDGGRGRLVGVKVLEGAVIALQLAAGLGCRGRDLSCSMPIAASHY